MQIISWNVNGLRSVWVKGGFQWLLNSGADIICLQEIKIQESVLIQDLAAPKGYFSYFNFAKKPGYSGVAIYTRKKPRIIKTDLGHNRFDEEGRFMLHKFADFLLINVYFPHGGRIKDKLPYKLEVYDYFLEILRKMRARNIVLIGDFNIAHKEEDLARPKANKNNVMFTPEEREKLDRLLNLGFLDSFREFTKEGGHYTWWPYYANARQRNLGWRLDYGFVSRPLRPILKQSVILNKVLGSDHCPIRLEMEW